MTKRNNAVLCHVSRWKRTRFWAVHDGDGRLIAVTVYKQGADAVKRLAESAGGTCGKVERGEAMTSATLRA